MKWLAGRFIEGFFILLPALIAYLMVGQLFDGLMALTQPVVDVLPTQLFASDFGHRATAGIVMVGLFAAVGMLSATGPGRRFGRFVERRVLERFAPYKVIKTLFARVAGKDVPDQLQPALLTVSPDVRVLVAIVEELSDGQLTVFVPIAPTPGVGHLQIVAASRVERLEASMSSALGWVLNWGTGTQAMLDERRASRVES